MLENDFNDVYASLNIHLVSMFSLKMHAHTHAAFYYHNDDSDIDGCAAGYVILQFNVET